MELSNTYMKDYICNILLQKEEKLKTDELHVQLKKLEKKSKRVKSGRKEMIKDKCPKFVYIYVLLLYC